MDILFVFCKIILPYLIVNALIIRNAFFKVVP